MTADDEIRIGKPTAVDTHKRKERQVLPDDSTAIVKLPEYGTIEWANHLIEEGDKLITDGNEKHRAVGRWMWEESQKRRLSLAATFRELTEEGLRVESKTAYRWVGEVPEYKQLQAEKKANPTAQAKWNRKNRNEIHNSQVEKSVSANEGTTQEQPHVLDGEVVKSNENHDLQVHVTEPEEIPQVEEAISQETKVNTAALDELESEELPQIIRFRGADFSFDEIWSYEIFFTEEAGTRLKVIANEQNITPVELLTHSLQEGLFSQYRINLIEGKENK